MLGNLDRALVANVTHVKEEATKGLDSSGAVKIFTLLIIFFEL